MSVKSKAGTARQASGSKSSETMGHNFAGVALAVDRKQVLAFRRRAMHLVERLPAGSLVEAARGGLQDSGPRSAVISLAARQHGTQPDDWEHPELVQVWGPRAAVYVVAAADF